MIKNYINSDLVKVTSTSLPKLDLYLSSSGYIDNSLSLIISIINSYDIG